VYAVEVESYHNVESALHIAFGPNRINPIREFFQSEEDQAVVILKVLAIDHSIQNSTLLVSR
jgi:hypothetical protein